MFFVEDLNGDLIATTSTFDAATERAIAEVQRDIRDDPDPRMQQDRLPYYTVKQTPNVTICVMERWFGPGWTVRCRQYAEPVDDAKQVHFSLIEWTNTVRAERDAEWVAATGRATPAEAKQHLDELWEERDALLTENRRLLSAERRATDHDDLRRDAEREREG